MSELDNQVPSVVVPESTVPTSNSPGLLEVKLATVLFPTPAFPKNTFAVSGPWHEFDIIPLKDFQVSVVLRDKY